MTALIQIENLHYRPGTLPPEVPDILRGIDLIINEGDFVAIIGKNGSGKTTLIKHINGLLLPTRGFVLVDGMDTRQDENRPMLQTQVGMVFQNPADQIVASTVEEDVAFGLENLNLPTADIRARVAEKLAFVGMQNQADRPPHLLSGGQIQKVALAGVLARQPRIILFDEPTSMLDPQTRSAFMTQLQELHLSGITIIYITHHMEETVYANQVVVMDAGTIAFTGSPAEIYWGKYNLYELGLDKPEAVRLAQNFMSLGWQFDRPTLTPDDLIHALPEFLGNGKQHFKQRVDIADDLNLPLVQMEGVHYTYLLGSPLAQKALNGVNFRVPKSQIHAIAGANGSGKSTLLQQINGILRPVSGSVRVGEFHLEDPQTALRDVIQRVGLVFQSPETQFFEVFVGDEIAYGPKQFKMEGLRKDVSQAMLMVGLDFNAFKDRRLETLSSGEKRKVALASTLVLDQEILLFDEPTAGMDPNARDDLLRLFKTLQDQGKTIIIASHRMEELAYVADHLSLMQAGVITHTGACNSVMADTFAVQQAGLLPPLSVQIAQSLIENGWPIIPEDASTPDRLLSAIRGCQS